MVTSATEPAAERRCRSAACPILFVLVLASIFFTVKIMSNAYDQGGDVSPIRAACRVLNVVGA